MFYALALSHNKAVPIDTKQNIYLLSLNTWINVLVWGSSNSDKIEQMQNKYCYDCEKYNN